MAGQTINDRLLAARHSLAGQGLAKSVCKATTEEMIGPKKKHLDYLVHCTNEPNVSIPQLANLLVERSQNANWVVVYKSLITVHHMLAYGNERFTQYLASSNSSFQLSNFLDKGGVQAGAVGSRVGYDMSPFIRRYAKYLNEKALSYRTVAFDFCKVKRGKEEGSLRTMNAEKLLKTLPVLQAQLDCLLEFDCTANDLTNGVINMCFMLMFRDLIRLFACYNDGIINLLEKYFDMNKKQCRDALDLYKKFLIRMDRVGEFLKVAENVGIDKGDIPDLTKAPSSLLDALEQHLASVEGKKGSAANTPTQTASNQKNVKSGVSALSSTSSAFGMVANSANLENNGIEEGLRQQILAEEEAVLNQYKSKLQSPTNASSTNPFLSSPVGSGPQIVDLFGSVSAGPGSQGAATKASDDLLQLGNPFADMFGAPQPAAPLNNNNMWTNGFTTQSASNNSTSFVSDSNFSSVFGHSEPTADDGIPNPFMSEGGGGGGGGIFDASANMFSPPQPSSGDPLQSHKAPPARPPQPQASKSALDDLNDSIMMALGGSPHKQAPMVSQASPARQMTGFDAMGDVLRPAGTAPGMAQQPVPLAGQAGYTSVGNMAPTGHGTSAGGKVLTGDLDSSLASLANNLTINKSAQAQVKGVQWNSPKNAAKPGSAGWTPQPMAATTGAGYRPMGQGMPHTVSPSPFPLTQPMGMQGIQPMQGMRPMMPSGVGVPMAPSGMGASMMGGVPSMVPNSQQQPPLANQQASGNIPLDPFGAL